MRLDDVLPSYHVRERHRVAALAPPAEALAAAREVSPADVPVVRALFRLRGLGRGGGAGGSLVAAMLGSGFRVLVDEEDELVIGAVGRPWRLREPLRQDVDFAGFDEPGYAKMALNLRADGSTLSTETRVLLTDADARRAFGLYWLLVRPWSGLVRRLWLRAAARALRRAHAATARG